MKKIEDFAAFVFIVAVGVLSVISVLGIWDFFNKDVINKSFETLGLLAFVAVVVMLAGRFIEGRSIQEAGAQLPAIPNPAFKVIRQITLTILIVAVSLLAVLGVLAIWEVIKDKDVLYKSMSSVGVLAFGALIITMTSLQGEGKEFMGNKNGKGFSVGGVVFILVLLYLLAHFWF
jgi:uncharacterized protein YggT (Ycf19 family)